MPFRSRRRALGLGALLLVFVGTRSLGGWVADHPERYGSVPFTFTGDVDVYERWATDVARQDQSPYGDVRIEYPPGALPFILAPLAGADGGAYRPRFVTLMVVVDTAGLVALLLIARRTESRWGPRRGRSSSPFSDRSPTSAWTWCRR
ncbi:MAG: hypothetical protein M3203_16785, partial [Actinomycetota bacterium]|nr:hypothetical protein [Actinomycetota bacterium]